MSDSSEVRTGVIDGWCNRTYVGWVKQGDGKPSVRLDLERLKGDNKPDLTCFEVRSRLTGATVLYDLDAGCEIEPRACCWQLA